MSIKSAIKRQQQAAKRAEERKLALQAYDQHIEQLKANGAERLPTYQEWLGAAGSTQRRFKGVKRPTIR